MPSGGVSGCSRYGRHRGVVLPCEAIDLIDGEKTVGANEIRKDDDAEGLG
jgi:hypothetical protein